jgi:tripartite-type tricarboxylate transporter receptor subunit TctC
VLLRHNGHACGCGVAVQVVLWEIANTRADKGGAAATADIIGRRVTLMIETAPNALAHARAGQCRSAACALMMRASLSGIEKFTG